MHDDDTQLADAMLVHAKGYNIKRNDPYGPEDGVTHTLKYHCIPNGFLNVMIEIKNTLITTDSECMTIASDLHTWLEQALDSIAASSGDGHSA